MINSQYYDISQESCHTKQRYQSADQTPLKRRVDNLSTYIQERNSQTAYQSSLDDVLSSQKMRWAKKGSMKVSYLEDPSYNFVHNDVLNTSFQMKDSYINESSLQDDAQTRKQKWTNNYIKTLMKQKDKQQDISYSQQFFKILDLKMQNQRNLQKVNDPPKYKLYQTSVQKRNLPPVKLKQLKYLQYFEEKKAQQPHLYQPLNEIVIPSQYEIIPDTFKTQQNIDKDQHQQNFIRNHAYQQADMFYSDLGIQYDSTEKQKESNPLSYIQEAFKQQIYNKPQNNTMQRSSDKSIQSDTVNSSPIRKLPRVFGSRNNSPLNNRNSKTPPKQQQILQNQHKKINLKELQIDDIEQKSNFYSHGVNHLDQNYQFTLKSTQITPINKRISSNFYEVQSNQANQSYDYSPPNKHKYPQTMTHAQNKQKKFEFILTSKEHELSQKFNKYSLKNENSLEQNPIFISR